MYNNRDNERPVSCIQFQIEMCFDLKGFQFDYDTK